MSCWKEKYSIVLNYLIIQSFWFIHQLDWSGFLIQLALTLLSVTSLTNFSLFLTVYTAILYRIWLQKTSFMHHFHDSFMTLTAFLKNLKAPLRKTHPRLMCCTWARHIETWADSVLSIYIVSVCVYRVLYGNKIAEIPKGLFDGLVSLQLLWVLHLWLRNLQCQDDNDFCVCVNRAGSRFHY